MNAPQIVVVGTSMGGLGALQRLLCDIPEDFRCPVAIVQHRSSESGDGMVKHLRRFTRLAVREPEDKEPIYPAHIYVAPPDYHLLVEPGEFQLSTGPTVKFARPSIDVLFESAADAYADSVLAVILTGASDDGTRGAQRIRESGGRVLVQDPSTAESPLMPQAAIRSGCADEVLPLSSIPARLASLCVEELAAGR